MLRQDVRIVQILPHLVWFSDAIYRNRPPQKEDYEVNNEKKDSKNRVTTSSMFQETWLLFPWTVSVTQNKSLEGLCPHIFSCEM